MKATPPLLEPIQNHPEFATLAKDICALDGNNNIQERESSFIGLLSIKAGPLRRTRLHDLKPTSMLGKKCSVIEDPKVRSLCNDLAQRSGLDAAAAEKLYVLNILKMFLKTSPLIGTTNPATWEEKFDPDAEIVWQRRRNGTL